MAITSILKPDGSIALGLATGILVYAVYDHSLPTTAVVHATDAGDMNIEASRKKAAWMSAGVVSAVTLLTKDVNILILGGVVLFGLDFHTRHANASNPETGDLVSPAPGYPGLKSVSAA
jgi:hypothetical protein